MSEEYQPGNQYTVSQPTCKLGPRSKKQRLCLLQLPISWSGAAAGTIALKEGGLAGATLTVNGSAAQYHLVETGKHSQSRLHAVFPGEKLRLTPVPQTFSLLKAGQVDEVMRERNGSPPLEVPKVAEPGLQEAAPDSSGRADTKDSKHKKKKKKKREKDILATKTD